MVESLLPEFGFVQHALYHTTLVVIVLIENRAFVHKSFHFFFVLFDSCKKVEFFIGFLS